MNFTPQYPWTLKDAVPSLKRACSLSLQALPFFTAYLAVFLHAFARSFSALPSFPAFLGLLSLSRFQFLSKDAQFKCEHSNSYCNIWSRWSPVVLQGHQKNQLWTSNSEVLFQHWTGKEGKCQVLNYTATFTISCINWSNMKICHHSARRLKNKTPPKLINTYIYKNLYTFLYI